MAPSLVGSKSVNERGKNFVPETPYSEVELQPSSAGLIIIWRQELGKTAFSETRITRYGLDDGHSWRKYGQKEILGARHPRPVLLSGSDQVDVHEYWCATTAVFFPPSDFDAEVPPVWLRSV
ncbi:hypothetical protein RHMOL_Rhmol11G0121200 [Rhododendron molle]|uniref:Uncharacterized protein n=1 Tax=Rhododendron molle TaxID=49168 RepID=A0ACC0LRM2_RHOML|nr:hypothetical protein RHMOL_Rhmol11G0121200 [Rhododendron molle]